MSDNVPEQPEPDDPSPDETDIIAYLDGELDGEESRVVESKLALDPAARAKADALKKTYDLLDYLPRSEPSPNFTHRTITQISLPVGKTSSSVPVALAVPSSSPTGRWRLVVWAAGCVLASASGYFAHAVLPKPTDSGLAFSDVRVIENLPLYLGVDDLDYLKRLEDADLFRDEVPEEAGGGRLSQSEPVTAARREALTALFRSYPLARQQQLRQLDQQLYELDPPARDRLIAVLERYAVWLDRLPDADRKEVLSAPAPAERLDTVRRVKLRAWRLALPATSQARLESARDADELALRIAELKKREADRRAGWEMARRQWEELKRDQKPWPFSDPILAKKVEEFAAKVLKPRLTPGEANEFNQILARLPKEAGQEGNGLSWFVYGATLLELSERHPTLPEFGNGSPPIVSVAQLPDAFRADLLAAAKKQRVPLPRKVLERQLEGRWPEFAEAVARDAKMLGVAVRFPIGPARPVDFSKELAEFTTGPLKNRLRPEEWKELERKEGHWPDYPRRMLAMARDHDLSVPGATLPGEPSKWERFYRPVRSGRKGP